MPYWRLDNEKFTPEHNQNLSDSKILFSMWWCLFTEKQWSRSIQEQNITRVQNHVPFQLLLPAPSTPKSSSSPGFWHRRLTWPVVKLCVNWIRECALVPGSWCSPFWLWDLPVSLPMAVIHLLSLLCCVTATIYLSSLGGRLVLGCSRCCFEYSCMCVLLNICACFCWKRSSCVIG